MVGDDALPGAGKIAKVLLILPDEEKKSKRNVGQWGNMILECGIN